MRCLVQNYLLQKIFWFEGMHKSQNYLTAHLYPGSPASNVVIAHALSADEVRKLHSSLKEDAADYLYSSAVSLGDALCGITQGLFTWATVKLYYSVFYALRARLALTGVCLFYIGTHPYSIYARAGELAHKEKGQTHKLVIKLFRHHKLEPFLLSQPIGVEDPLDWLTNLREDANYKIARFIEPNIPKHFITLSQIGIRRACQAYLSDKTAIYLFDPDHAILAYPLELLERTFSEFKVHNLSAQKKEDMAFMQALFSDEKGPMAHVLKLFSK